jgi:hypothetical protein
MTLSNEDIGAIDRIFMINTSGTDVRTKVAKQWHHRSLRRARWPR